MIRIFILCTSLALCSCQTISINTPSGRPEVTAKSSISRAKTTAIHMMASAGYSLASQSENTLTFECQMPPGDAALYLIAVGNSYYSQPVWTTRFTFVPVGNEVKIYGTVKASAQGPFGQIQSTDLTTGKAGQQLQQLLEEIRRRVNSR
ncbi:MAG: hypothetical protein WCS43_09640 [Verrucomicrobiota bacterium]